MNDSTSESIACFNCRKDIPASESASLPAVMKVAAMATFLVISQTLRWPTDICKTCARQVYAFVFFFGFLLVILFFTMSQ